MAGKNVRERCARGLASGVCVRECYLWTDLEHGRFRVSEEFKKKRSLNFCARKKKKKKRSVFIYTRRALHSGRAKDPTEEQNEEQTSHIFRRRRR